MTTRQTTVIQVENRRSSNREKSFEKTTYSDARGRVYRTQLINSSDDGARLTTGLNVRVGDTLHIRQVLNSGTLVEVAVEVMWRNPAGLCQIVGVRKLDRLPRLVSQAA